MIEWASYQKWNGYRISELLIMIPNGAYLGADPRTRAIVMAKLKKTGFKPGVFDYLLPVPCRQYAGLWLELKRQKGGRMSNEQDDFVILQNQLGWRTVVVKGWKQASEFIMDYLKMVDSAEASPDLIRFRADR